MTLEQILDLYYCPKNHYKYGSTFGGHDQYKVVSASRTAIGDVILNGGAFIHYNTDKTVESNHKKEHDFILDIPAHNFHLEGLQYNGLRYGPMSKFSFSKIWPAKLDDYLAHIILSLRLAGYLVACWQGTLFCSMTKETISFDADALTPVPYEIPAPLYTIPLSAHTFIDAKFRKYRNNNDPTIGFRSKEIIYRYIVDGTANDAQNRIHHFQQNPRDFFLSFIK